MDKENNVSLSVIIPACNAEKSLSLLLNSLEMQSTKPLEIIVIDDYSTDSTPEIALKYRVQLIKNSGKKGPAVSRNLGIRNSRGKILAFIDADCIAQKDWIENILKEFSLLQTSVIMGKVEIPRSTFLGDVISALGFPAGGHVGFENMWHVDKEGKTDHISSCNFAMTQDTVIKVGFFDETFPYPGCEDVDYSIRCVKNGIPIYYKERVKITHPPRKGIRKFIKWHLLRGRSNYHLKRKIKKVGNLIALRAWSSKNICKKYIFDIKLPFIIIFLLLSFILQQIGYLLEKFKRV